MQSSSRSRLQRRGLAREFYVFEGRFRSPSTAHRHKLYETFTVNFSGKRYRDETSSVYNIKEWSLMCSAEEGEKKREDAGDMTNASTRALLSGIVAWIHTDTHSIICTRGMRNPHGHFSLYNAKFDIIDHRHRVYLIILEPIVLSTYGESCILRRRERRLFTHRVYWFLLG